MLFRFTKETLKRGEHDQRNGASGATGSEGGGGKGNAKNFFAPGGQHNPLKRLDSDKEMAIE
jgi:hypothetical protein